jgi:hypothetical protein
MNPDENANVNTPHQDPRGKNQRGGNQRGKPGDDTSRDEQPGPGRSEPSQDDDEDGDQRSPRR